MQGEEIEDNAYAKSSSVTRLYNEGFAMKCIMGKFYIFIIIVSFEKPKVWK